jgi:hypothetical protein
MMAAANIPAFYAVWTPLLLVADASSRSLHASPAAVEVQIIGISWPVVTMAIVAVGVLAARLLSPRRTPPLGLGRAVLATMIMLIAAELWVIDTRPGLLFAFVVGVGLGFSGYSLIELMGDQMVAFVKRWFAALPLPGRRTGDPEAPGRKAGDPAATAPSNHDPDEDSL